MTTEYKIEYLNYPSTMVGLPYYLKWNIYQYIKGIPFHLEGFRTKKEAKEYLESLK